MNETKEQGTKKKLENGFSACLVGVENKKVVGETCRIWLNSHKGEMSPCPYIVSPY